MSRGRQARSNKRQQMIPEAARLCSNKRLLSTSKSGNSIACQQTSIRKGSIRSCHQQAAGGRGCGRDIHHDASSCHWRCSRVEAPKKGHLVGTVIVEEGLVANLQEMD